MFFSSLNQICQLVVLVTGFKTSGMCPAAAFLGESHSELVITVCTQMTPSYCPSLRFTLNLVNTSAHVLMCDDIMSISSLIGWSKKRLCRQRGSPEGTDVCSDEPNSAESSHCWSAVGPPSHPSSHPLPANTHKHT